MFEATHPKARPAGDDQAQIPTGEEALAGLPTRWITRLACPTCHVPDALLLLAQVGTVCRECGETTRIHNQTQEVNS